MRSSKYHNKKGQAVAEMALFGSLLLLIFASLLSYLQRSNDQQYVQMEGFRRALEKANSYVPPDGGAGAAVQHTLIQNRRHIDISGGFRKGNDQTLSANSNVFWAVPEVGKKPESLIVYKINEDEKVANMKEFIPEGEEDEKSFRAEDIKFISELSFNETLTKQETTEDITNANVSQLKDTITTTIPYTIRQKDEDFDPDNDVIISSGIFWEPTQGVYQDASDDQYKYREQAVGTVVERSKTWTTGF